MAAYAKEAGPENALIAIENDLARSPDLFIERDRVRALLSEHGADFGDALPHLEQLYARAFSHAVAKNGISQFEARQLQRLRESLGLSAEDAKRLEAPLIRDLYQQAVRDAVADGRLEAHEEAT